MIGPIRSRRGRGRGGAPRGRSSAPPTLLRRTRRRPRQRPSSYLAEPRARADDVERRAAGARERARRRPEVAGADPRDRRGERSPRALRVGARERRRDDGIGVLEEVVDDLDLAGSRAKAGERVDGLLGRYSVLDDLGRVTSDAARSSCSRARAPAPSIQRTSRRPLTSTPSSSKANGRSGRAPSSAAIRAASAEPEYARTSSPTRASSSSVTAGTSRARALRARRHGRRGRREVDALEEPVHGVADLGRVQPAGLAARPGAPTGAGCIPTTRSA